MIVAKPNAIHRRRAIPIPPTKSLRRFRRVRNNETRAIRSAACRMKRHLRESPDYRGLCIEGQQTRITVSVCGALSALRLDCARSGRLHPSVTKQGRPPAEPPIFAEFYLEFHRKYVVAGHVFLRVIRPVILRAPRLESFSTESGPARLGERLRCVITQWFAVVADPNRRTESALSSSRLNRHVAPRMEPVRSRCTS